MNQMTLRRGLILSAVVCAVAVVMACGSSVQGTYSSASGTMLLELRSGGKASFTMMGETHDCTYKVSGKKIQLTCGTDGFDFDIHDDGSLTSSAPFIAATFGALKKTK